MTSGTIHFQPSDSAAIRQRRCLVIRAAKNALWPSARWNGPVPGASEWNCNRVVTRCYQLGRESSSERSLMYRKARDW